MGWKMMLNPDTQSEIEARISTAIRLLGETGSTLESLLEFLEENMAAVSIEKQAGIKYMYRQVGKRIEALQIVENKFTRAGLSRRILN
jgi:hypothetical protein